MMLINIQTLAKSLCASNGHYYPGTKRCPECKSQMGKPASTLRLMARQGRIPGAIIHGTEWLVDPQKISGLQFAGRGRPKNKRKGENGK